MTTYSIAIGKMETTDGLINEEREMLRFENLQWTTEPPEREGWYWYFWKHPKNNSAGIEYINEDLQYHDTLPWDDEGIWRPVNEFLQPYGVYWLGPLPVPEPPSEGE